MRGRRQVTPAGRPSRGGDLARRWPITHDVAAAVAAGLEQHRVHRRLRRQPRPRAPGPTGPARSRRSLPSGGPAQTIELLDMFCALNGATFDPATRERAAQAGRDDALAGVGRGAGDEQPVCAVECERSEPRAGSDVHRPITQPAALRAAAAPPRSRRARRRPDRTSSSESVPRLAPHQIGQSSRPSRSSERLSITTMLSWPGVDRLAQPAAGGDVHRLRRPRAARSGAGRRAAAAR